MDNVNGISSKEMYVQDSNGNIVRVPLIFESMKKLESNRRCSFCGRVESTGTVIEKLTCDNRWICNQCSYVKGICNG